MIGLCLLCLFMAACAGCLSLWTGDITIAPEVEPQPPRVGQVTITVRVTQAGKPVTGARTRFEGNMSHAGMAPVFADAREIEPGRYRANMELNMAGDWVVSVQLTLTDGTNFYQQFKITVLNAEISEHLRRKRVRRAFCVSVPSKKTTVV
jgi:hypothetical protein